MTARTRGENAPELRVLSSGSNEKRQPRLLSPRDKRLLDLLLSGSTEEAAAKACNISRQRVNAIRHTPAAQAYIIGKASGVRGAVNAIALTMIHDRLVLAMQTHTEQTISLDDLVKIVKISTPKIETSEAAYEMLYQEAERIANDVGLSGDRRRQFFQWLRENAA